MQQYLKLAAAQYLFDFRRAHNIKKSTELSECCRGRKKEKKKVISFPLRYSDNKCFVFQVQYVQPRGSCILHG